METMDIAKTLYKIGDFLSWQRAGTLKLSPSFQRRPVWSPGAKAYLIDTIARGLPVPIIFIRERTDLKTFEPKREVVDGQQRLRTVLSYIDPKCLPDYKPSRDDFVIARDLNSDLAGKEFVRLDEDIQSRILDYQFSVHILPSGTDDRLVLQIFARMNSTGVKLNGQELRNAGYFGQFKTSMYQLALENLTNWRDWRIYTESQIARMLEVEGTSDLAIFIIFGTFGLTQDRLDKVYGDFDKDFAERSEVEKRFRNTMEAIDQVIGQEIAQTVFRGRLLFFATFALFYDLLYGVRSELAPKAPAKLPSSLKSRLLDLNSRISQGSIPEDIAAAISRRTTHPSTREAIFGYFRSVI